MPGTVDYLKDKLTCAIDEEGNVLDITKVAEVVRDLEQTELTAEDLTMTRLGRIVNSARRKMPDKGLAKRMKKLVKQWQKLAAGLNNGTTALDDKMSGSTPSPTKPPPFGIAAQSNRKNAGYGPIPESKKVDNSSIPTLGPSPAKQTTPTSLSTTLTSTVCSSHSSSNTPIALNSLRRPEHSSATTPINSLTSQINGQNINSDNLIISLPLNQISKHQRTKERLPEHEPPNEKRTEALVEQSKVEKNSKDQLQQDLPQLSPPITSLVVQLSRRFIDSLREPLLAMPPTPPTPTPSELIVSIKRSRLKCITLENKQIPTVSLQPALCSSASPIKDQQIELRIVNSGSSSSGKVLHSTAPSGRLKNLSKTLSDCDFSIDGCIGCDGSWYAWEDHIPSTDEGVTVLPYIYIDGLSGDNEEQMCFSSDTRELISNLENFSSYV